MALSDYARRLFALAETIHRWLGLLARLDRDNREKLARYAESVADTLARAAVALDALGTDGTARANQLGAERELGRISGYIEMFVAALEDQLDGRKLQGVKRRLERLKPLELDALLADRRGADAAERFSAAEGYFRALADALRT